MNKSLSLVKKRRKKTLNTRKTVLLTIALPAARGTLRTNVSRFEIPIDTTETHRGSTSIAVKTIRRSALNAD